MLEPDASDAELIRAAARNHVSWMARGAQVAGGDIVRERRLRWIAPAASAGGEAALPFPGVPSRPALDRMLAGCRARGAVGVGCWASGLEPTGELAARLVARGFEWGWQPHWMAIDLARVPADADDPRVSLVEAVPEYGGYGQTLMALARSRPRRFWHAVARVDGAYAGHAWAHVVNGRLGGAGIYDVEVAPEHRLKGLGRALTAAVCRPAAAAGAHVATLNATGEGELLYRSLGFRSLGHGQTWWLHRPGLKAPPPADLVALAEAAGRGDVGSLARLAPAPELLAARLANGYDAPHVALHAGHREAAAWLVDHGAPLDAVLAWDLGGEERLTALARDERAALDAPVDSDGSTVLHLAVWRGDIALLDLALSLGADRERRDTAHDATAAEWARYFGREDLAARLRA
jgi:GNAT superfamily N-acetyltransferase